MSKKTIVVTGGSTGIGKSICDRLLQEDYQVVNLSRRASDMGHEHIHDYALDLADRQATRVVAAEVASKFKVSGLVHNAGVIRPNLMEDVELEDLDYLTNLHLGAAILLTQAFLPHMKSEGFGRVVLITSRAALGLQTRTSYSATKAGMMGMVRTWALELGEHGITVNSVAPGPIAATEMFHNVTPEGSPELEEMAVGIPVKRLGNPADVANAVSFFIAPQASFVTGQTLMVCGGTSLGSLSQ